MKRLAAAALLFACTHAPATVPLGKYGRSDGAVLELHLGHDGATRGYFREGQRIAALSAVRYDGRHLLTSAVFDDGTRSELRLDLRPFGRPAVESQASAATRRQIEEAYAQLASAVQRKDFPAFQALRTNDFATIPPDGIPSPGSRMAGRGRGMLERIQPPITNSNDILALTVRAGEAIATVRQKFTRQQTIEGRDRTVHTEVTQRETWQQTADGWKIVFVDEVRDHITLVDGERVR